MEEQVVNSSSKNSSTKTLGERKEILEEIELRERRRANQISARRMAFIFSIAFVITGVFLWAQTEFMAEFLISGSFDQSSSQDGRVAANIKLFGSFLILISTVLFSYLFMVGFNPRKQRDADSSSVNIETENNDNLAIVALLRSIDKSLEQGKLESVLSADERAEVISKISEIVENQLNESLLLKIEQKYGSVILNHKLAKTAEKSLSTTVNRLREYGEKLQSKASVNLAYGIGTTIAAIMILIFLLFNASAPEEATNISKLFYYTSRFFLVVLVQGVSIFFLNLYKSTLNDIMYINNETTNYEAKRDSLALAFYCGNKDAATSVMATLANTERNFTLKKGETSIFNSHDVRKVENPISGAMIQDFLSKIVHK